MKIKKKFLSVIIAVLLAFSVAVPAFAAVTVELYEHMTSFPAEALSTPMTDISKHALRDEIEKAYTLNFAMGVSDTKFDPDATLNCEQAIAIAVRVFDRFIGGSAEGQG